MSTTEYTSVRAAAQALYSYIRAVGDGPRFADLVNDLGASLDAERLDALMFGANASEQLLCIGRAIGFGRAQQILGEQWEAEHDCAPRGRMGVTVKEQPADEKLLRALSKYIHPVLQELQFERGTGSLAAHNLRLCLIEVEKALRGERDASLEVGVGFPLSSVKVPGSDPGAAA